MKLGITFDIIEVMKSIKVDIIKSNMISNFASNQFYDSWRVVIKELLMNAMDACYTRQALEWSWGTEFLEIEQAHVLNSIREPLDARITITYDSSSHMLSVEDNGIGMNVSDLENYVAKIGESFYTSPAFFQQRLEYDPISRHGIGLCSCFMISRALLIESKKDKSINTAWNVMEPQSVEAVMAKWFEDGVGIEYVNTTRKESGTKITLPLKQSVAKYFDMDLLVNLVKHYMMYQPIPITIICDGKRTVLHQEKMEWKKPFVDVLGVTTIEVDNDWLEGYIVIYNSRQKHFIGESKLYQQNFLVTEHIEELMLCPEWTNNFSFVLNIKKHLLNMNMSHNLVAKDEKLRELREMIGAIVYEHFTDSPMLLGQYLKDGYEPMLSSFEQENDLVSRAVSVWVYLKEQEIELPIKTVINGFMGRKIKVAAISKQLFTYLKKGFGFNFKKFIEGYDLIIFEPNLNVFLQFIGPYIKSNRYVIGETPGLIYIDIAVDLTTKKNVISYRGMSAPRPTECENDQVFCLVSNDLIKPMELVLNPANRNAQLLQQAENYDKVRKMRAVIIENIKQRILGSQKHWDKLIDFGGMFVVDWDSTKALSLQSVWCLESGFADKINEYVAKTLTPQEIVKYGLSSLYFTDEDFISWWLPPH